MLVDADLPAAAHLAGPGATAVLTTAVEAFGGRLGRHEVAQVQHQPGHGLVVRYDAEVAWAGGPPRRETLLATTRVDGLPPGTLVLQTDALEVGVWRYPFDPHLPGLASATTPARAAALLAADAVALEVVAYRPTRRAVVRADLVRATRYLKVVPPAETAAMAGRHGWFEAAGLPVPRVEQTTDDGVLVLAALPGRSLRDVLLDPRRAWPAATTLLDLLDGIRAIPPGGAAPSVRSPLADAPGHARALRAVLPRHTALLEEVLAALATVEPDAGLVTTHGDLYEAQLTVARGRITGVLDLDDAGPGHPLDDVATLLAHLHLLRPAERSHRTRLGRLARDVRAGTLERLDADPGALDRRTAAVLLGLATGPFRAQQPGWRRGVGDRIRLAARLALGGAGDESTLRPAS